VKRFAKSLLFLLPIGLLVVGVNLWVDPAGLFHRQQEKQVVAYLLDGHNVANVGNYDYRKAQRHYAAGLTEAKEVLVFGSSRSMVMDSAFYPGQALYNASVPAGTLHDVLAGYQLFLERGLIPARVVLGVEPYMLNGTYRNRLYLHAEYRRALARLGLSHLDDTPFLARLVDPRYTQLVSPSYFQVSLGNVSRMFRNGRPVPYPTKAYVVDEDMVRADGSLSYAESRRSRDAEFVHDKAVRFIAKHPEELANFRVLDPGLRKMFETFVEGLLDAGIDVDFLMAPYHPMTYQLMGANPAYQCVGEAGAYFTAFAADHGILVYGSYDPAACGVAATDFYDAVHSSPEALLRVFQAARGELRD